MPAAATRGKITGTVFVQFIIDATGQVQDVQVVKAMGYGCAEEAVRVVSLMPQWKPGMMKGKPVSVR